MAVVATPNPQYQLFIETVDKNVRKNIKNIKVFVATLPETVSSAADLSALEQRTTELINNLPGIRAKAKEVGDTQSANDLEELRTQVSEYTQLFTAMQSQLNSYASLAGKTVTFLERVQGFEVFKLGLTLVGAEMATLKSAMQSYETDLEKAEEKASDICAELAALPGDLDKGKEQQDRARKILKDCKKTFQSQRELLAASSRFSTDITGKMRSAINDQAWTMYVSTHPNADMQLLNAVNSAGTIVVDVGITGTPNAWKWIPGLVQTCREAAYRVTREVMLNKAINKASAGKAVGQVFVKFDEDPLMVATYLKDLIILNVTTLMTAINTGLNDVPGWSLVSRAIQQTVKELCEKRLVVVTEPEKNKPDPGKVLKEEAKEAVKTVKDGAKAAKEFLKSAADGMSDLKQKLTDAVKSVKLDDVVQKLNDTSVTDAVDWAVGAGGISGSSAGQDFALWIFQPVVDKVVEVVVKCIPVEPAQLVTGGDLSGLVEDASLADEIRARFPKTGQATKQPKPLPLPPLKKSDIYPHKGNVVASDIREGESGAQHVAFKCFGAKVWGWLSEPASDGELGVWTPERPDASARNDDAWKERTITDVGYTSKAGEVKDGEWVLTEDLTEYYVYLRQQRAASEWLHKSVPTGLGMLAAQAFAKLEKNLETVSLDPA
jgi:hypothetical protein